MYSLILVDYNSLPITVSYISRCRQALGETGASHIVIVENGAKDGALETLSDAFGPYEAHTYDGICQALYHFRQGNCHIVYCHSGENMGYARGNNLGAQIAQKVWADPYYIISNNDLEFETVFDLGVAQKLFEENPRIGVIGPQVRTPEGKVQSPHKWIKAFRRLILFIWVWAIGGALSAERRRKLFSYCEDTVYDAPTGACAWVSGCFFVVRAEAFFDCGMFDPNTFLYAEELILSRRMERQGYEVWFCRELEIIHKHAQTTQNAFSAFRMLEIDFQSVSYYYKTYTDTSSLLLLLAKCNFKIYKYTYFVWNKVKVLRKGEKDPV